MSRYRKNFFDLGTVTGLVIVAAETAFIVGVGCLTAAFFLRFYH